MIVMGIDPGLKGGIGFWNGTELKVYPTPVNEVTFVKNGKKRKRSEMNLKAVVELIRTHKPDKAFLEKVNAMPGQGVTGMFRFGQNAGQWQGILAGCEIPFEEIPPQRWKKVLYLNSDKVGSLDLAKSLFPEHEKIWKLKKNDGLAEGSLIAKFGYDLNDVHVEPEESNDLDDED